MKYAYDDTSRYIGTVNPHQEEKALAAGLSLTDLAPERGAAHHSFFEDGAWVEKPEVVATEDAERQAIANRRKAYAEEMPIGDQLDAIWETFNLIRMQNQINLPQEADDLLGVRNSIKQRFPKS